MRKVRFYLGTGFVRGSYEEIMEFEDDTTDEEIEECYEDWKNNKLSCSWWDIEED